MRSLYKRNGSCVIHFENVCDKIYTLRTILAHGESPVHYYISTRYKMELIFLSRLLVNFFYSTKSNYQVLHSS